MKKYLYTFLLAIIIGFFLAHFSINQYKNYEGIKVSTQGENLYFIQYGVFSSKQSMEENTISLQNYVYNVADNLYYVYVGITRKEENANKIINYYKNKGVETILKKYIITNKEFLSNIENYDKVLNNTDDETTILSIVNQVLTKYEEVVISGG